MKNLQSLVNLIGIIVATFIYYVILSIAFTILNIHWLVSLKIVAALLCTFADFIGMKGGD